MIFTLKELTSWLGISVLEMWLWIVSALVSSIMLLLKLGWGLLPNLKNEHILIPMIVADGLSFYFNIIVFVRVWINIKGGFRRGASKFMWSVAITASLFLCKHLLMQKLKSPGDDDLKDYSAVMSPIFISVQLVMLRACHMT